MKRKLSKDTDWGWKSSFSDLAYFKTSIGYCVDLKQGKRWDSNIEFGETSGILAPTYYTLPKEFVTNE